MSGNTTKMKANWRRGARRAWVAFSIPWVGWFAYQAIDAQINATRAQREFITWERKLDTLPMADQPGLSSADAADRQATFDEYQHFAEFWGMLRQHELERLHDSLTWGAAAPAILGALIIVLRWVAAGFRTQ